MSSPLPRIGESRGGGVSKGDGDRGHHLATTPKTDGKFDYSVSETVPPPEAPKADDKDEGFLGTSPALQPTAGTPTTTTARKRFALLRTQSRSTTSPGSRSAPSPTPCTATRGEAPAQSTDSGLNRIGGHPRCRYATFRLPVATRAASSVRPRYACFSVAIWTKHS